MKRFRGIYRKQESEIRIMENNNETNIENNVDTEVKDGVQDNNSDTTTKDEESTDTVTMSKADYDKAIQSAEDKVRGKLSKEINTLKEKIKELSPVEKSQAEIDLENRIAALEESERQVQEQKRKLEIQELLSGKNLDKSLVDFLKDDADVEALSNIIDEIVKSRMKSNSYVPGDHTSDDKVTPEEFKKMSYSQKLELSEKSPELFKRLMAKKK